MLILFVILALLLSLALACLAGGFYRTRKIEHDPKQALFRAGTISDPLPDGPHKGYAFIRSSKGWQGKVFDRKNAAGVNQFAGGQRYPFKTYPSTGLRDKDLQVLRIDYNQPSNPWWLRLIVDEIVQTKPEHYLGKMHAKVLGIAFTLAYFELTSE